MAGAQIDKGSAVKIARNLGENGKPMPEEIAADPALRAAYYDGAGTADPDAKPPEKHPQTNPTDKSGGTAPRGTAARPPATTSRRAGAATKAKAGAGAVGKGYRSIRSGSAGGLLLAVFLYPIGVAMLQHGPGGAVAWLKAKFLNEVGTTSGAGAPPGYYNNGTKDNPNVGTS